MTNDLRNTPDFKQPSDEELFEDLLSSLRRTTTSMANGTAMLQYYVKKLGLDRGRCEHALNMLESAERAFVRLQQEYDDRDG